MSKETNQLAGITQQLKTLIGAKNDNSQVVSAIDALRMTMQVNQMEKRETDKNAPTALAAAVAAKEGKMGSLADGGGISDQLDFQRRFKAGRAGTFFDRYFLPSERRAQDEIDAAKRETAEGDTHVNAIVDFGECIRLCTDGGVQTLADEIIGVKESVVLLAGNTADFFHQWFAMMKLQLIDKEEQRREKTKRLQAPSMVIDGEVVDDDEDGPSLTDGIAGLWAGSKVLKVLKWAVIGLPVSIYKFFKLIGTKWFGKFTKSKMGLKYAKYLARPRVWPIIAGAMIAGYFWNGIKDIWSDGTGEGPHGEDVTGFDDPAAADGGGEDGTDWINIAGNVSIAWMAANMAARTTKGALLLKWASKHWKLGAAIGAGARKATVGSFMWSALKMAGRATAVGIGALTPLGWAAIVGAAVSYYYWDEIQGLMKSAWENEFGIVENPLHAETIFNAMVDNSGYYSKPNMEGPGADHMLMLAKDSVMKRLAQFMGPKNKANMNRAKQFMLSQGWSMDEINDMLTELSTSDTLWQGAIVKMRRKAGVADSGIPLIDNAFVSRWHHLSGNKKAMGFLENIPKLISEKPADEIAAGNVIIVPDDSPLKGTLDINKINSDNISTITVTHINGSSEAITYQDESLDYNVPVVQKKRGFAPI